MAAGPGGRFDGANLTGAGLVRANLTCARLDQANHTGAWLTAANLTDRDSVTGSTAGDPRGGGILLPAGMTRPATWADRGESDT